MVTSSPMKSGLIIPNFHQGIARNASQSARPQDWPGLVGLWIPSLQSPGGFTLRDWSGHGNHGTLTSMDPALAWVFDPQQGRLIDLDGGNDYIQTGCSDLKTSPDLTLMVLFKADSTVFGKHLMWAGDVLGNGGGNEHEMCLNIGSMRTGDADTLQMFCQFATGAEFEVTTAFTDTTQFHWLVGVFKDLDGTPSGELFLDGVPKGTTSTTTISRANFDTNLRLGRPGVATRFFNGQIAQARVYTRALPLPLILAIIADPLGVVRPKGRVSYLVPAAPAGGWGGLLSNQRNRLTYVS